jgi:hypothetical protein
MPSPADLMQTVTLANVTSIRTSGDHGYLVGPGFLWAWFLYTNALARALGLWPFKDVFRSDGAPEHHSEVEALLSSLSGGPVGIGDPVGATDADLVRRTCRADGVLLKPDAPVAAVDRCFARHAVARPAMLVGETHTDHPAGRWHYVIAMNVYRRDEPLSERVPCAEGVVWDWRTRTATTGGGWDLTLDPLGWDYRVVAPVLAGGIAVIGDPDVFVPAADRRLRVSATADTVDAVVIGAPGETVSIVGWAAAPVVIGAETHDGGVWRVEVTLPDRGWERLRLRLA